MSVNAYEPVVVGVTRLYHRHNLEGAEETASCAACEIARLREQVAALKERVTVLEVEIDRWHSYHCPGCIYEGTTHHG